MKIIKWSGCFFSLIFSMSVLAAEVDRNAPILIEAAEVMVDEASGVSTYKGQVLFEQGGMQLRAEKVAVHSDGRTLNKVKADGTPVVLEVKGLDGGSTRAEAKSMQYFVGDGRLIMEGDAQLWQDGNHFSGGRIEFDTFNDRILASREGEEGRRVRVVIHPNMLNSNDELPPQ